MLQALDQFRGHGSTRCWAVYAVLCCRQLSGPEAPGWEWKQRHCHAQSTNLTDSSRCTPGSRWFKGVRFVTAGFWQDCFDDVLYGLSSKCLWVGFLSEMLQVDWREQMQQKAKPLCQQEEWLQDSFPDHMLFTTAERSWTLGLFWCEDSSLCLLQRGFWYSEIDKATCYTAIKRTCLFVFCGTMGQWNLRSMFQKLPGFSACSTEFLSGAKTSSPVNPDSPAVIWRSPMYIRMARHHQEPRSTSKHQILRSKIADVGEVLTKQKGEAVPSGRWMSKRPSANVAGCPLLPFVCSDT